jgi:hypothetical protein
MRKNKEKEILKDHEVEFIEAGTGRRPTTYPYSFSHSFIQSIPFLVCVMGLSVVFVSWEKYGQERSVSKRIETLK